MAYLNAVALRCHKPLHASNRAIRQAYLDAARMTGLGSEDLLHKPLLVVIRSVVFLFDDPHAFADFDLIPRRRIGIVVVVWHIAANGSPSNLSCEFYEIMQDR